jgi:hypothetical protein
MSRTFRTALFAAGLVVALAGASTSVFAGDYQREDVAPMFTMQQIDQDHDAMVSKQEFLDMMARAWDMEAAKMKAHDGKMTREQYRAFSHLFGLDVGN